MQSIFSLVTPTELMLALSIAAIAGAVKGLVGFAMPMVLISGLGTFLAPELALAGLILPTLVTNGLQALRQGLRAAVRTLVRFRVFLSIGLIFLLGSAQLVRFLPGATLLLLIGLPFTVFALLQLLGWRLVLSAPSLRVEAIVAAVAGFIGGLSGVWGPPTVAYLTAINTEKTEQMRIQGVIYGLGAVALLVAHIGSGVLRPQTVPFSAILILPAVLGMWLGGLVQDRIDQRTFRQATMVVLLIAGLNLIRRGLTL